MCLDIVEGFQSASGCCGGILMVVDVVLEQFGYPASFPPYDRHLQPGLPLCALRIGYPAGSQVRSVRHVGDARGQSSVWRGCCVMLRYYDREGLPVMDARRISMRSLHRVAHGRPPRSLAGSVFLEFYYWGRFVRTSA